MATMTLKKTSKSHASEGLDAISLLKDFHKKVTDLFDKYEKTKEGGSTREKLSLVKAICSELLIHAAIEEEIFYPAVRKEIHDDDVMNEATVEHEGAKTLIHQLEDMSLTMKCTMRRSRFLVNISGIT